MKRRQQPEQHTRRQRRGDRECQRSEIEVHHSEVDGSQPADPLRGKSMLRIQGRQRPHTPPGYGDAHRAADDGQEQALGEQLPDESPPRGADGESHRDLPLPRRRAHEKEIREIGARDQQDEERGAEKHQERAAYDRIDAPSRPTRPCVASSGTRHQHVRREPRRPSVLAPPKRPAASERPC